MFRRRGDISLADLVRAFRELKADEETRFAVAKLLKLTPYASLEELRGGPARPVLSQDGFTIGESAIGEDALVSGPSTGAAGPTVEESRPDAEQVTEPAEIIEPEEAAEEISPGPESFPVIPSRLTKVGDGQVGAPKLRTDEQLLDRDVRRNGDGGPAFEPLLLPVWTRAILSGALSSRSDDGPLDVRKVVEKVAAGEASSQLPRHPRPTLARGVQVLVDRSETMQLFLEDQRWLEGEIQKVVGPSRAQILYFEGCPTRKAGSGSRRRWKSYLEHHLPSSGTVLLLLTDLGVGQPVSTARPAGVEEWLVFAERLRKHGCPIVAFVPYAPERCPAALHSLITILQWDRVTSVSLIHARVGKGHVS